jgi:hypothetical protein
LFEYNDEDLDTGIQEIDVIEQDYAYTYQLQLAENSNFIKIGDTATQILGDGTIMTGEVSKWSDSDSILHLIHIGADDGNYHEFVTSQVVTVNDSDFTVLSVAEENKISQNEQNDEFSTFSDDFLDFTETNPFGDPENS